MPRYLTYNSRKLEYCWSSAVRSSACCRYSRSVIIQEQIDKADAQAKGSALLAKLAVRVRVVRSVPEPEAVRVNWRRGGEGLGGLEAQVHLAARADEDACRLPAGRLPEHVGTPRHARRGTVDRAIERGDVLAAVPRQQVPLLLRARARAWCSAWPRVALQ